jgi:hypothetical protein
MRGGVREQAETTIPARQQRLVCNGRELAPPTATLASVGVTNGDLVMLLSAPAAPAAAPAANPAVAATTAAAAAAAAARRNPPGASRILGWLGPCSSPETTGSVRALELST